MSDHYSVELLKTALAGNLPANDESSLQQHLDSCDECSATLERLVGGAAFCEEAATLLKADELDVAAPFREEWSEVDFTVEHLEPSDDPQVLGRLGGYDILEIIGRGGMGVVLKGFDRELKRCVAIKVLAPHLAQSSLAKQRFAREAQAAAAVVHPNVLAIHQVQPNGRLPFLVMPLVAGESLAERMSAQGTLELKEILRIGMQAAAGLAAAHEQGLVHRDVKPANILLEKGVERAVLTDFGLARAADDVALTRWGIIAGTPQYMSPEQARGEPLDARSDLFSLGCVLYEMATGVSPFRTDTMIATLRRLVDETPKSMASIKPDLPPWFIALVERLLEKQPDRRFSSAREVSALLEGCLAHVQQPATVALPTGLPKPVRRGIWRMPHFGRATVLALLATLGIGLLGFFLLESEPPDITGDWTGEEWGQVRLKKSGDAEYVGTYTDTVGKTPGTLEVRWSRIERQFKGKWREGDDRFGKISLRLKGVELRGSYTTAAESKVNPATPEQSDLTWVRPKMDLAAAKAAQLEFVLVGDVTVSDGDLVDLETGRVITLGTPPEPDWIQKYGIDAKADTSPSLRGLVPLGGTVVVPLDHWAWPTFKPADVQRVLKNVAPDLKGSVAMSAAKDIPAVFAFKTATGGMGLVRIKKFVTSGDKTTLSIEYNVLGVPGPLPVTLLGNPPNTPAADERELLIRAGRFDEANFRFPQKGATTSALAPEWGDPGTDGLRIRLLLQPYSQQSATSSGVHRMRLVNATKAAAILADLFVASKPAEVGETAPKAAPPVLLSGKQLEVTLSATESRVLRTKDRIKSVNDFDTSLIRVAAIPGIFITGAYIAPDDKKSVQAEKLEWSLDAPTSLNGTNTPLGDALKFLADQHGISIKLDEAGLKEAGVKADTELTINVDNLKFKTLLKRILGPHKLGYQIKEGELLITSQAQAEKLNELHILGLAPGRTRITVVEDNGEEHQVQVVVTATLTTVLPRIVPDPSKNTVSVSGRDEIVQFALHALQAIDHHPGLTPAQMAAIRVEAARALVPTVPRLTSENSEAILEVWNTGQFKAVRLGEHHIAEHGNLPADDWLVGLSIKVIDKNHVTRRFFRRDTNREWPEGFTGPIRLVPAGEKVRFKIQLHDLLDLRGEYDLQPMMELEKRLDPLGAEWLGKATGKPVRVQIDADEVKQAESAGKSVAQAKIETLPRRSTLRVQEHVAAAPRDQESAVAKLVLVFFMDKSRRAVPAMLVQVGDHAYAITSLAAIVVPDGTTPAIDRAFVEWDGRPAVAATYSPLSTTEFSVYQVKDKILGIGLQETALVAVGDRVSTVPLRGATREEATVVHLDREKEFELPERRIKRTYVKLIQVDRTFPEGTPLFKDGKLAGITLLGSRFVGEKANTSFVVPAQRIADLCRLLEKESPRKEKGKGAGTY